MRETTTEEGGGRVDNHIVLDLNEGAESRRAEPKKKLQQSS